MGVSMKKDYIKLYINNVVCRLPEKDRDEVRRELSSNIYDMLSAAPDEDEIKAVLEGLGSPAKLAEKYRVNPRYLISPAVFDNYIVALKIGVPAIALISAFVSFIEALFGIVGNNISEISVIASEIMGASMSALFSGAFYSAVMITLGFVIYEKIDKNEKEPKKWRIGQLKEVSISSDKNYIPLSGSVASIVVTVFLSMFFMLFLQNNIPGFVWLENNDTKIYKIFSDEFSKILLYIIPLLAAVGIFINILKMKYRKWNAGILLSDIAASILHMASFTFLFTRPNILSGEFTDFIRSLSIDSPGLVDSLISGRAVALMSISIVVIVCLISIGESVWKLIKIKS